MWRDPALWIGKKGIEIEKLKTDLEKLIKREVILDIQEVRKAEVDAQLVAENVAMQLVRRVAFRRAMKRASALLSDSGHRESKYPAVVA